jgi:SagB-type dehydrogenase family enzyme
MMTASNYNTVLAYHNRTKHRLERYAAGPETLDWTSQPDPFREFNGAPKLMLPFADKHLTTAFTDLYQASAVCAQPFDLHSIGILFELSLAISAWKEYGPDRWALRCNPSSGNLHPTEGYILCAGIPDLSDGVYHYVSRDHVLEQRFRPSANPGSSDDAKLFIGLSSIHWREAWKYGERAFRYCQHDVGHAIGALRYAAAVLGWPVRIVQNLSSGQLAGLLGLNRNPDFTGAEQEEPEILLEISTYTASGTTPLPAWDFAQGQWFGQANTLDRHPMYHWPVIDEVAAATRFPATTWATTQTLPVYPPISQANDTDAGVIIRQRRSAQHFDAKSTISAAAFYHILDSLLPRPAPPWDVWPSPPRLHLLLFVHRVDGLSPGLYLLARSRSAETQLRAALSREFSWSSPQDCPEHLPLFQLAATDCTQAARTLSCHQAIAGQSFFSLGMLAEFEATLQTAPWRYRELFWEAGLLGQVLYLEAEAAGVRGTGIGCYFDDAVHDAIGLSGHGFQSLYHFTVGYPLQDNRILTLPPYPDRS